MVYLGAVLAEMAGIEAIIGAFLAGLALNRLIPHTSPLMNRVEFVGNAIFIPFFLIGVGMLIDYRAFIQDTETIKVASVMTLIALLSKFLAALVTQKTYKFSADERRVIFGLSSAQAAATLAAVLVGYNLIIGTDAAGNDIRLLDESVLNGTILMILVTCAIASFTAQKGAQNIALSEATNKNQEESNSKERILIPISNIDTTDELINLGIIVKSKKNTDGLYALSIVKNDSDDNSAADKKAKKLLDKAAVTASATDNSLHQLLRYDQNIINGITSVVMENQITDLILGLHIKQKISDSFLGELTEGILNKCNITTLIYKSTQPFSTIKKHVVVVPHKAEKEIGFPFWIVKLWNIAKNSGAKLVFYGTPETLKFIQEIHSKHPIPCEFEEFSDWNDFLILARDLQPDDNLIVVLSRKNKPSYQNNMNKVPDYLNKYFQKNSFILIYPMQIGVADSSKIDLKNPTVLEPIEKLDEIGKTIAKMFGRR